MTDDKRTVPAPASGRSWRDDYAPLLAQIDGIEEKVETTELAYDGLKVLDDVYTLINLKLDAAHLLLHHPDQRESKERIREAGRRARQALALSDSLQSADISLDQKELVIDSEEMGDIRGKMQRLILFGGAALFEAEDAKVNKTRRVSAALRKALLKYTGGQHQRTGEKIVAEDHLAKYEIKEGEEDILLSDRMTLPLSQAVILIEEELLPAIESRLKEKPGDFDLIQKQRYLIDQLADFKTAKFFPRARPHTAETDLFTASLSGFTATGEALVTVDLKSIRSSGNTYDHLLEHLRVEIIRDCAGAGICRDLDAEIKKSRSSRAGKRFSLTEVLNRLNVPELFRSLSMDYPFLRRIENREDLKLLADLAAQGRKRELNRLISKMAGEDSSLLSSSMSGLELPGGEETPPS